jgi:beta-lactamase superfamily II metal-dependent hydrolase
MMAAAIACGANEERTLDIYFIDVEGGQSTLVVTPAGESLLIDAGFPGTGTFSSVAGAPDRARDAQRILAAARDAGVSRIDYLLVTHYHGDHAGGIPEVAALLPITTFIDHSAPPQETEIWVPGTQAIYRAYVAVRDKGQHLEPQPGDRIPLHGVEAVIVATEGRTISQPLPGAGAANPRCTDAGIAAEDVYENPRSTAMQLTYGTFRFLNLGDLSGAPLHDLVCPVNKLGISDVYLIAHHGGADAAGPATFAAVQPAVAIMNNGETKGGAPPVFETLRQFPDIQLFQLHRTTNRESDNMPPEQIANPDSTTHTWLKVSAKSDGSFSVSRGGIGATTVVKRMR